MGQFRYEAVDKAGKVVRGVMNARDEQQVRQSLTAMGFSARGIYGAQQPAAPAQQAQAAAPAQASSGGMQAVTIASGVPVSIRPKVPIAVLAKYFRHLATLIKSGMPIVQALTEMNMVTRHSALQRTLPTFQESAQAGRSLSGAMAQYPDIFPVHTVASVWSGELSGRLDVALDEIATDLETEARDLRFGRFGWALVKINLVGLAIMLPALNLGNLLLPAFSESMKMSDPKPGDVLRVIWQTYVNTMLWKSIVGAMVLIVVWIVWGYLKRVPVVKRTLDGLLIATPAWGAYHRQMCMARFLHVMDMLYAAGISPGQAWDAASLTVRNSALAERLKLARSRCGQGAGPVELLNASGVFEPEEVAMAASGEKAGQIPAVLGNLSKAYEDMAASTKTRNKVLGGFLLLVFFGLIAIAGIVPIAQGYSQMTDKVYDLMLGKP